MSDLRPIDILTGEIAVEVTGVVGVSPALWYFRSIASNFRLYTSACVACRPLASIITGQFLNKLCNIATFLFLINHMTYLLFFIKILY